MKRVNSCPSGQTTDGRIPAKNRTRIDASGSAKASAVSDKPKLCNTQYAATIVLLLASAFLLWTVKFMETISSSPIDRRNGIRKKTNLLADETLQGKVRAMNERDGAAVLPRNAPFNPEGRVRNEDKNYDPAIHIDNKRAATGAVILPFKELFNGGNQALDKNGVVDPTVLTDIDPPFPRWIADYLAWHKKVRLKYPGTSLLTDPSAPKVLVRICLGLCGGLHDRLGQLPFDLYVANATQRILLIKWERPHPLEEFLLPNDVDWLFPTGAKGWEEIRAVRAQPRFPMDNIDERAEASENFDEFLDAALEETIRGKLKDERVLSYRILAHLHEALLEKRLRLAGETDMIHRTATFGNIFRAFFRLHPTIQATVDQIQEELKLVPDRFTAVHCRVRHPMSFSHGKMTKGKSDQYPADKTGLPFEGEMKDFAVDHATHAIQCGKTLSATPEEPIYFFSDSNDLVRYMVHDLRNESYFHDAACLFNTSNAADAKALDTVRGLPLRARDVTADNCHIDKNRGRKVYEYYGVFVDLTLGMQARCVTYGVGKYASFAAKISGIHCKLQHATEKWGSEVNVKKLDPMCEL